MYIAEENLKELAYELYKIHWKREHLSKEREIAEYRLYYFSLLDDYGEDALSCDYDIPTFDEWIDGYGYEGELYVCFDEFIDAEYEDVDYMSFLLGNSIFWKAYKEYMGV